MNLTPYVKACYPIIYLVTPEEARAELIIRKTAEELKRKIRIWSFTDGFRSLDDKTAKNSETTDPTDALFQLRDESPEKSGEIVVMRDLHMFLTNPKPIRLLRDIANIFKKNRKTLILVSPIKKIPPELEHDITVIELELPSQEEIRIIFNSLYSPPDAKALESVRHAVGEILPEEQEKIIQAASGLTFAEIDNILAKAFVEYSANKTESLVRLVLKEKAVAVKKSGILEYFEPKQTIDDIGGLENLKAWIKLRSKVFTQKAKDFDLPLIRGILLAGPPGTGKSLSAKVASQILGVPLLRFDIGKVFGGLVGDSERGMRTAIQMAEQIGSCVLFIDEIEKAFAGMGNSHFSTDSGTSQRVFGQFLTFMQEKITPCFIIATVNRIDGLPMELLRKGRFDEIFFVGLPNSKEREQIFKVHLRLKNQKIKEDSPLFKECLKLSKGFSGAEIEGAIITAIYQAFDQNRKINEEDLLEAVKLTNPLSQSRAAELKAMIEWAKTNAINASQPDKEEKDASELSFANAGRQLQFGL